MTFGIKKFSSRSLQYEQKLLIYNEIVSSDKSGNSFKYLGRYFNFEMDNEAHKKKIKSSPPPPLSDMINNTDFLSFLLTSNKNISQSSLHPFRSSWHLLYQHYQETCIHLLNSFNVNTSYVTP